MGLVVGMPNRYVEAWLTAIKEPDNAHGKRPCRRLPIRVQ